MPFTPIHMGPGILIKSILKSGFSLMVFGWTQIVMDIQPLIVLISGEGHLHGFTHTYIGAILIAIFSAITGKYLSVIGLFILGLNDDWGIKIGWGVCFFSAIIGSFTHVFLDSIMWNDVQPFFPFFEDNVFLNIISVKSLHKFCYYSSILGAIIYFSPYFFNKHIKNKVKNKNIKDWLK